MKTVLNDKRMPMRVKARIYTKLVVRSVVTYASECCGLKKKGKKKVKYNRDKNATMRDVV